MSKNSSKEVLIGSKNEANNNPVSIITLIKNRKEVGFIAEVNEMFVNSDSTFREIPDNFPKDETNRN